MSETYTQRGPVRQVMRSRLIEAATPLVDVLLYTTLPVRLQAARLVYVEPTNEHAAKTSIALGTSVDTANIIAATPVGTKGTGAITVLALQMTTLPAETPIILVHTGAAKLPGRYYLEVEYLQLGPG